MPLRSNQSHRSGTYPPAAATTACDRVLFVDDDELSRRQFSHLLRREGLQVDVAIGADEAVALSRRAQYALVACDLMMPWLDGARTIERLRMSQENARFVVVTGAEPDHAHRMLSDSRIDGMLFKPFQPSEVLKVVHTLVDDFHSEQHEDHGGKLKLRDAVLTLDDNAGDAKLLEIYLRELVDGELQILTAESVAEGLNVLAGKIPVGLVLTDLGLPDAEGVESVEALRRATTSPIVVVSAASDESTALRAVQAGAQEYVLKEELDPRRLARAIKQASERRRSEQRLTLAANYDPLTGAANRGLFERELEARLAEAEPFGVLFADLDLFKQINDTHGHDVGDALLSAVAARLSEPLGGRGLLARMGGDEFALLCDDVYDEASRLQMIERTQEVLRAPYDLLGHSLHVTVSIGSALFPYDATDAKSLMRHADTTMYARKGARRRSSTSHPAVELAREEALERSLRAALDQDELAVLQQPIIRLCDSAVVATEALLRWRREHGVVLPSGFLTTLEQTGLIVRVGRWVVERSLSDLTFLRALAPELELHLNVTRRQLEEHDFALDLLDRLDSHAVSPGSIILETGEETLLSRQRSVQQSLRLLKQAGIRFALDDFASVPLHLAQVCDAAPDMLKLDRSIVCSLSDPERRRTAEAAVAMAHALKLPIIAVGIETDAERRELMALGCKLGQGRLFAAPATARLNAIRLRAP